jgi:tetratricopeptide (TPR) repeat protein
MSADEAAPGQAREALEEGRRRFLEEDLLGAHACFADAYKRAPQLPPVASWYGLTLVLVERNSNLGVALCDQALRLAGPEPDLILNLARAHLALGQRDRAVRAVQRGLAAWPEDASLRSAQAELGKRQRPVIPFLPRDNPLNRMLGRMRHRGRGGAGRGPVTPSSLGRLPPHLATRRSDG